MFTKLNNNLKRNIYLRQYQPYKKHTKINNEVYFPTNPTLKDEI